MHNTPEPGSAGIHCRPWFHRPGHLVIVSQRGSPVVSHRSHVPETTSGGLVDFWSVTLCVGGGVCGGLCHAVGMVTGTARLHAGRAGAGGVDFFISYTGADQAWAEWVAWQLEDTGHTTRVQAWDFGAGSRFVHEMHQAAQEAERTVAVLSAAYLRSAYAEAEWQAAWAADPSGQRRRLLVLRVEDCDRPGLLGQLVSVDLFGLDPDAARDRLLAAADGQRAKPTRPPAFPTASTTTVPITATGAVQPHFPGLPQVWNVPARLATFTGRQQLLDQVRAGLASGGGRVAVTALRGLGGVGKTQLAVEYAWRHAADYHLVWWVNAEQAALVGEQLAALASHLGVPATGAVAADAAAVLAALAHRDDWLLAFDNAESAGEIRGWLPPAGCGTGPGRQPGPCRWRPGRRRPVPTPTAGSPTRRRSR